MFTHYGEKITALRQGRCAYETFNHGQMPRCFPTQAFYSYQLLTEGGRIASNSGSMDVVQAERFAKFNGLKMEK